MTQAEIYKLTLLINQSTSAKPEMDAEDFMLHHWQPFVNALSLTDRRMAWQVYLKAQANHLHVIVEYLQTLSPAKIRQLTPALEKFVSIGAGIRNWGEEPVTV